MICIVGTRGTGKTTRLLELSAQSGIPIAVRDVIHATWRVVISMSRLGKRHVLDNLCMVSQDMSRRILTCEKRERESVKVSYEDLVMWSDIVGDAIEVINDKGGSHGR